MYFEAIKTVLDRSIQAYSERVGLSIADIDSEITTHIRATSAEHRNPDPNINYCEPLCRLGYLFTHAGANAYLFEQVLLLDHTLSALVRARAGQQISLCTVGGGPGTELLGLTKYLLDTGIVPSSIRFTVLDNIPEWGETWEYISEASQDLLRSSLGACPVIHPGFYPMDVVKQQSYTTYAWLFQRVDIIVYNYLISENKVRLPAFEGALTEMVNRSADGCLFVVIDRLERHTAFRREVRELFERSDLEIVAEYTIGGVMPDSESVFGDYLERFDRRPRRWFQTPQRGYPTVFVIVAQKPTPIPF